MLTPVYLESEGLADLRGYKTTGEGLLGRLILNAVAFRGIWELNLLDPVALGVLDQPLSPHLVRCQAVAAHTVGACSVHVPGTGASERLVALRTVLRLVADDDFPAVSACPSHGNYPSTTQTPRQACRHPRFTA